MKIVIFDLPPYFLDLDAPNLGAEEVSIDCVTRRREWCGVRPFDPAEAGLPRVFD